MRVDVYLDVSCPWCYIAKRQFEAALTDLADPRVRVVRHPYQIDGELPAEPMPMLHWLAGKYGADVARRMSDEVTRHGERLGMRFANDAGYAVNTLAAHRLLWLAGREADGAVQGELEELLFAGYFTDAVDISAPKVLVERAERAGLDPARVSRFLDGDEGVAEVRELVRRGREETSRVPYFVLDGTVRLTDVHDRDRLLTALRQVSEGNRG
ncbi:DsbA family oxidoreductase [Plantactinospora endophytica]|uniref:Polyketide synthase n=1 Tax=Plantactinospora endophytica TaxID=673535 RepID=A0ABQ4E6V8_9ACTN|nr:DsbA family oxidoreductase [Plantactinospora endophytica]GIG90426.1 polyketide synthase [Plantactinospora endophytica]